MKILNLKAENIKKLVAVDITPEGDTVIITGQNGAGKSSVLDAIYWALAGSKHIQDKPIREGAEKGSIRLDLGKYIVERRFTEKASYLTVSAADGAKYPSPQDLLDDLTASITFDPLEFSRMDGKKQYETLRRLVPLEVDIDKLDQENKADFDRRTEVNRKVKDLAAQVSGLKAQIPADAPTDPVDIVSLANEINADKEAIRHRQVLEQTLRQVEQDIILTLQKLQDLRDREKQGKELINAAVVPTAVDLKTKEDRLGKANETNRLVDLQNQAKLKTDDLAKQEAAAEALTAAMAERTKKKEEAIGKAQMPVAGLSLNEGKVLYADIPFEQCSSAEQLRISTAIAMAANPELRVIRIKDGSLLDDAGMNILKAMASEKDFQIWIERVSDSDPIAIVIEEGQVRQPQEQSQKAA